MHAFLQSMLGKSTEELSYSSTKNSTLRGNEMKIEYSRSTWIRKLGNNSPKKYKSMSSPKLSISSIESRLHNISDVPDKVPVMFHQPAKMPDLETIIREFENNFLSPSKSDASSNSGPKEGNFVRKIVAAFEDKYKTYNDSKIEEDVKAVLDNRKVSRRNVQEQSQSRFSLPSESPKKRTNIFGSTPKILNEKTEKEESKMSVSFNLSKEKHNGQKNTWISIFSSPFKYGASKESKRSQIPSMSPESKLHQDGTRTMNEEDEDHRERSSWDLSEVDELNDFRFERVSSPFKTSDDETKSIQSVDLSLTYDIEDSTLLEIDLRRIEESTMIICSDENESRGDGDGDGEEEGIRTSSESTSSSKGSRKMPKIIGAFLKRPIEVEKTAVDWIPIMGKKLPRKRSLKKLLSMLTRNKSNEKRREKIFSSERNINEEPRELQDSGYDEKSSTSTSSLKSLVSISEILLHQNHPDRFEMRQRNGSKLKTFQTRNSLNRANDTNNDGEEDESIDDEFLLSKVTGKKKKKLRLTEVPREIVTKNLGPCYPSHTAIMTMSLDRRSHSKSSFRQVPRSRIPRHPYLSHIPKHPFVSTTKMDEIPQVESHPAIVSSSLTDSKDDREKSFQIDREEQPGQECTYDVPRRYLSKSESKINEVEPENRSSEDDEPIYDMPKPHPLSRPTSSIYEDALSLKRRLDYLPMVAVPNFYSVSDDDEEPHYATIRRGNRRVHCSFNQQLPSMSYNDLRGHELSTSL